MNKLPFFLLLILLLKITISVDSQDPALLKYVLQWPPTFCFHLNSEEEGRCKEPIREHQFTLHGLMPADDQGFSLVCDPGEDPNWDELFEPIQDELETFWPSLREDFNETELWKHEWRAHGACGGMYTPEEYFRTAIDINNLPEEGNLFNYLEESGIVASDIEAYTKEEIFEAVQKLVNENNNVALIRKLYSANVLDTSSLRRSPPNRRPPPPPRRSPPPPPPPRRSPPPPPRRSPPPPPPPPGVLPPPTPPRNIYLSCIPINPDNTTHVYLSEVTLCTNTDGTEYVSCPLEADPSSCPDEALVMLPLPQPQEWEIPMERIAYI